MAANNTFPDDTGAIVCGHVIAGQPVLSVVWDGDLQVLCGGQHDSEAEVAAARILCLGHVRQQDPTTAAALHDLADRGQGYTAYRTAPGQPWVIEPLPPEEQAA